MGMKARVTGGFILRAGKERIDWRAVRDTISLADVATRLLGPPPGRRGVRSARRLWRPCPFHEDRNPSFCIKPGGRQWRCWGCGLKGDAIELVRRLNPGWTFPEAVAYLTGRPIPSCGHSKLSKPPAAGPVRPSMPTARPPAGPRVRAAEGPPDGPTGLPLADALALVDEAAKRLWMPEGRAALDYLIQTRGLAPETIRRHRLGWTPRVMLPTADGARVWPAAGIVIPWLDGDRLAKVEIRQPDGREPRYAQAFADLPRIYPGPESVRPGLPLIAVEGAFEAILLGQELADLASVITTGSSSTELDPAMLPTLLRAPEWFAAHDADSSGDKAAAKWPSRAVRIRPPIEPPAGKDWGDLHAKAPNAIRYLWGGILRRPGTPWEELAARRWGPGLTLEGPGFVID